jgi:hypothetical protein
MRDTAYAREIKRAHITLGDGSEARIERIFVKSERQDEIRFSWWKDGKIVMRPLDLSEADLINLIGEAVRNDLFTRNSLGTSETPSLIFEAWAGQAVRC